MLAPLGRLTHVPISEGAVVIGFLANSFVFCPQMQRCGFICYGSQSFGKIEGVERGEKRSLFCAYKKPGNFFWWFPSGLAQGLVRPQNLKSPPTRLFFSEPSFFRLHDFQP